MDADSAIQLPDLDTKGELPGELDFYLKFADRWYTSCFMIGWLWGGKEWEELDLDRGRGGFRLK